MEYLRYLAEKEGCYFRGRNEKIPLGYLLSRKSVADKLSAPVEHIMSKPLLFHFFEVFFPPNMIAEESIFDSVYAINARKGIALEYAISELEKDRKSHRIIMTKKDMGMGIFPVEGFPYSTKMHREPSYDIFCEHYKESDIRFHTHSIVRENACDLCSETDEYEKSVYLIQMSLRLLAKIKDIGEGTYEPYDLEKMIDRHNDLTDGMKIAKVKKSKNRI